MAYHKNTHNLDDDVVGAVMKKSITSLLLFLLSAIVATTVILDLTITAASAAVIVGGNSIHIGFARTVLLSGDMDSCIPDINASTCKGGIASALALFRNRSSTLSPKAEIFIPHLDKDTAFVQSHPDNIGVNPKIYTAFNISTFFIAPYILSNLKQNRYINFESDYTRTLGTNLEVPSAEIMSYFFNRVKMVGSGSHLTAILSAYRIDSTYTVNGVESIQTAVQQARKTAKIVVLLCDDRSKPSSEYFDELYPHTPDVVIGLWSSTNKPCVSVNGSYFCDIYTTSSTSTLASIQIDTEVINSSTTNVTGVSYINPSLTLTSDDQKDALYYTQQEALAVEAQLAIDNDPTIGFTNVEMPSGGRFDGTYPCYLGECGQGTLFMRSYLKKIPADLSFTSSGGFRGPGWSAGDLKVSNIWAASPFANTYCTGTLLGLRIWQLFDVSMSMARFSASYSLTGSRLLQASGVEVDVNPSLDDDTHRLIALRIYNNVTGKFEAVERLKYYTFTSDSFLCEGQADLSPFMQAPLYDGESVTVQTEDIIQTGALEYLQANKPYDNIYSGYLNTMSTSTSPLVWSTSQIDCGISQKWSPGVSSCIDCPAGTQGAGGTICIPEVKEQDLSIVWQIAVPVGAVLIAIVIAVLIWMECRRRRNVRNVANAPRGGAGVDVAIVFTDIQASTKLWGTVPSSMAVALDTHHNIIRSNLAKFHGYEVKTVGDCFMMALHTSEDAVKMCVAIQKEMAVTPWPAAIGEVYAAKTDEELGDIDDDENRTIVVEGPWSGLRVRIGVNSGPVDAVFDEVTKGYDYYGPTVNVAARVESSAAGGQILVSRAVEEALPNTTEWKVELFCSAELRGVAGKTDLLQIHVPGLDRTFTPPTQEEATLSKLEASKRLDSSNSQGSSSPTLTHPDQISDDIATINSGGLCDGQRAVYEGLVACLRVMPDPEKNKLVEGIAKWWRVKYNPKDHSQTLMNIARRAGQQIERKAAVKDHNKDKGNPGSGPTSVGGSLTLYLMGGGGEGGGEGGGVERAPSSIKGGKQQAKMEMEVNKSEDGATTTPRSNQQNSPY